MNRTKKRKLTLPKVQRAVFALEELLESDLPDGPQWRIGDTTTRERIKETLWNVVLPLEHLFDEDSDEQPR